MRLGNMYGPDATFAGVPAADLADPSSFAGAGAVIIGAPFDGGTSHRSGCRFGPQAIRFTDYLPHDGMRPSLALGVDPLVELGVVDVGDVEMPSGETELSCAATRGRRGGRRPQRCHPRRAWRRPHHRLSRRHRLCPPRRLGSGVDDPLRRPRRHGQRAVRPPPRARHPDAPAHRVRRRPRRPFPPGRAARLLARTRDAGLDGRPGDAQLRDDRGRHPGSRRLSDRGLRHRPRRLRRRLPVGRRRRGRPRFGARPPARPSPVV